MNAEMPASAEAWTPPAGELERLVTSRVDACRLATGMTAGLSEAGIRRYHSRGVADGVSGRSVGADTAFEVGSVTKLVTALLLADMVQRGEASATEPVADLLPRGVHVPDGPAGRRITLADLVAHTSGLPRLPDDIDPASPTPYAGYTAERLYAFLERHRLRYDPGGTVEYSNLGGGLLGHALALRAGAADYGNLVATRLCAPLGLARTAVDPPIAAGPSAATGAAVAAMGHDESLDPVPAWNFGVLAGAGGLWSCAEDLLALLEAIGDPGGRLGPAAAMLLVPRSEDAPLGMLLPAAGESLSLLAHEGGTGGFRAWIGWCPERRAGAAVLANAETGAVTDLGMHMLDGRCGPLWFRREANLKSTCFDVLAGRYRLWPGLVFEIAREGDRLYAQLTGQRRLRLFPTSTRHFFYKVVNAQVTFGPGSGGRPAYLVLHQNGRDRVAARIP